MKKLAYASRWLLCLLLCLPAGVVLAAAPVKIFVVPSKDGGPYAEAVQAIQKRMEGQRTADIDLRVLPPAVFRDIDIYVYRPVLIVTIGTEAAQRVARLNPPAPILHTLLPRDTALTILRSGRGAHPAAYRDSAIFLDQPIARQLDLVRLALPKHKRVAVILGPSTQHQATELRTAARERTLSIKIATIDKREDLLPTLEDLLDDNDLLLSVPEPLAYHSETIHHVLLTTYRYKIPMMGLSKSYVDAGALLAVHSTPEQIGQQVAQVLSSITAGRNVSLPSPGYPKFFQVTVNRRVAASLDLHLESDEVLQRKLETQGR